MVAQLQRRRFTVEEYYRMAEVGILTPDERLELLEGNIVRVIGNSSRHGAGVIRGNRLFSRSITDQALVSVRNPVRLDKYSEPEPDLALLRPRTDFYAAAHPEPEDVLLVIEVADTSLFTDRQTKVPLYAVAGIPEAWLANLVERVLEVYRQPGRQGYQDVLRLRPSESVSPLAFPDLTISVADLLGEPEPLEEP
ncbi:MAG: Uma2 family endonuclease [Chloroflexota bacterium]